MTAQSRSDISSPLIVAGVTQHEAKAGGVIPSAVSNSVAINKPFSVQRPEEIVVEHKPNQRSQQHSSTSLSLVSQEISVSRSHLSIIQTAVTAIASSGMLKCC